MDLVRPVGSVLLVISVLYASASSWNVRGVDDPPAFQPRDTAFIIWSILFFAALVHAAALWSFEDSASSAPTLLHAGAFVGCGVWTYAFHAGYYWSSLACIMTAFTSSVGALVLRASRLQWYVVDATVGPLAGWLLVAAGLNLSIALGRGNWLDSPWTLVGISFVAALLSAGLPSPSVMLPVLWACVFSRAFTPAVSASILSIVALTVSIIRVVTLIKYSL